MTRRLFLCFPMWLALMPAQAQLVKQNTIMSAPAAPKAVVPHTRSGAYTVYAIGSRKDPRGGYIQALERRTLQYGAGPARLLPAVSRFMEDSSTDLYQFSSLPQAHRLLVAAAVHNQSYYNGLNDLYLMTGSAAKP